MTDPPARLAPLLPATVEVLDRGVVLSVPVPDASGALGADVVTTDAHARALAWMLARVLPVGSPSPIR